MGKARRRGGARGSARGRRAPSVPSPVGGGLRHTPDRTELRGGREFLVRTLHGNAEGRVYRCPGCHHEVPSSQPHLVVWPNDGMLGVEERRHWHTRCWAMG
ncbi:hypothetical protein [Kytococcus schroeteri]|nr:hypothetical protein [Kytococcus schroeteri]